MSNNMTNKEMMENVDKKIDMIVDNFRDYRNEFRGFAKEQNKINQVTISNKNSVSLAWKFISGIIFSLVATIGIIITTIVIGI